MGWFFVLLSGELVEMATSTYCGDGGSYEMRDRMNLEDSLVNGDRFFNHVCWSKHICRLISTSTFGIREDAKTASLGIRNIHHHH